MNISQRGLENPSSEVRGGPHKPGRRAQREVQDARVHNEPVLPSGVDVVRVLLDLRVLFARRPGPDFHQLGLGSASHAQQ
jgi:hypothetical protein